MNSFKKKKICFKFENFTKGEKNLVEKKFKKIK